MTKDWGTRRPIRRILRLTGILLSVAVALACLVAALPRDRAEPENPILNATQTPIEPAAQGGVPQLQGEGHLGTESQEETQPQESTENRSEETSAPTEPEQTQESPDDTEPQRQEQTEPRETGPDQTAPQPTDSMTSDDPSAPTQTGPDGTEGTEPVDPDPTADPDPDEDDPRIVTDLSNRMVMTGELEGDRLPFYAYISGGDPNLTLRVHLRNTQTGGNGAYLTGPEGRYEAKLVLGKNYFTLYIKDGGRTVSQARFTITYVAEKADEGDPEVGDHPPTLHTNLDGWTEVIENQNFTLQVTARDYHGDVIHASGLQVTLDGREVTGPTGSGTQEYELYFEAPNVGEYEEHAITVLAWDGEGNSVFRSYRVTFHFIDQGGAIGTARIVLDATTLGLDWLDEPYSYEIKQGEPASCGILEMLEAYGYEASYGGTPQVGFYLRRIARGDVARDAQVPEELWNKILSDGLSLTGQKNRDSIGEFDYTQGAGWMYALNGTLYPGKGMSSCYLNNGDTLYIRFTLAYGKDIAGYDASGNGYGVLSTYCGLWIDGQYLEQHEYDAGSVRQEPTCTEAGIFAYTCRVQGCGQQKTERMEPLGHAFAETDRQEPTATEDGYVTYTCSRCGEQKRDILPKTGGETTPPTEPSEPSEPPTEPPHPFVSPPAETGATPIPGSQMDPKAVPWPLLLLGETAAVASERKHKFKSSRG